MTKKPKPRNYKLEYARDQASPTDIKHRAERNKARKDYEKAHGDLPKNIEIDHKKPLKKGGSNAKSNLQAISRHANRVKGARTTKGGKK